MSGFEHQLDPAAITQAIIQTIPDMVYVYDLDSHALVYCNRQVTELLGYTSEQMRDFGPGVVPTLVHPDDMELVKGYVARWADVRDNHVRESYYRCLNAKGEYRWLYGRDTAFAHDSVGRVTQILGTTRDVTARKQAEEEQAKREAAGRQKQKIEALGMLAAGVAHEINNPMTIVSGYANKLAALLPEDSPFKRQAFEMTKACERITAITRKLLAFARREDGNLHEVSLDHLVDDTMALVEATLRQDNIQLAIELGDAPARINCIPQQIQQVLMNLVTNARDALRVAHGPGPSTIRISSSSSSEAGRTFARLTVEDNGPGIPDGIMTRIFDPFFTTKAPNAGTGLGLSISHGIIEDHGGRLWAESAKGKPTRFHVDLPVADGSLSN